MPARCPIDRNPISTLRSSRRSCLSDLVVNLSNLLYPLPSLAMLHFQDVLERPVKVVGDVGYLLIQSIEGVAGYAPPKRFMSTAKLWLHSGQVAGIRLLPFSLTWR